MTEDNGSGQGTRSWLRLWQAGLAIIAGAFLILFGFWDGALAWVAAHWVGVTGIVLAGGGLLYLDHLTTPAVEEKPEPKEKDRERASDGKAGPGPGRRPVSPVGIVVASAWVVILALGILYSLLALWPDNTPAAAVFDSAAVVTTGGTGADTAAGAAEAALGYRRLPCDSARVGRILEPDSILDPDCETLAFVGTFVLSFEQRLLLIVVMAGALGGLIHGLRSLFWYTGNRKLTKSWLPMYVLQPFVGAGMATIFYLAVKGGFFVDGGNPGDTNPFGFAGLAAIVGMFSNPAALKLKELAETIFTRPPEGADAHSQQPDRAGGGNGDGGDGDGGDGGDDGAGGAAEPVATGAGEEERHAPGP